MRIGLVTAFPPGNNSLNEYGYHFARALASNDDVDEVVLFADRTPSGPPKELSGVTASQVWEFNRLSNLASIPRAVLAARLDAVLFNLQFATFGDTKLAGGLGLLTPAVTKKMGLPTGVVLHNLVENVNMKDAGFAGSVAMERLLSAAGTFLTKSMLRADYVSLTIPRYVEMVRERYGVENAILGPHGSFEDAIIPSFDLPEGPRKLLAFGKWGTYKRVDVLLDAYRELRRRGYDDLEVVIAGSDSTNAVGYLDRVKEENADLPGVQFTGYVAEDDVPRIFSDAAVVVFPYTSTTGSSGVLHQAGSYGRAAVLPEIGDFVEVIEEEGFLGEYFIAGDACSLADAIVNVIDDPIRRVEMGRVNFAAAAGIAMTDVVDWHVIHLQRIVRNGGKWQ